MTAASRRPDDHRRGTTVSGGGYDVAHGRRPAPISTHTVWSLDANGNQTGNPRGRRRHRQKAPRWSPSRPSSARTFNGDGHVGSPATPTAGNRLDRRGPQPSFSPATTTSSKVTGSNTLGPEVKQAGAPVTAGATTGGWTIIDAVQVAGGGYDVALGRRPAPISTPVWSLDASATRSAISPVASSPEKAPRWRTSRYAIFGEGPQRRWSRRAAATPPPVTVSTDGSTTLLVQSGNNYFL